MRHQFSKTAPVSLATAMTLLGGMAASAQTPPTAPPAAPTVAAPAPEQAPTPAPNYNIQYNGLIDGYYQFQFQNPKGSGVLSGDRAYDVRHNTPTLSLAELNVFKLAKPGGFGFKTTLIAGDTADINHLSFGGANNQESRFKSVQQIYGTYAFAGAGGGIDFGKFYTPFGYEVTEANANYNYSRGLPYFQLPIYHAGIRAYTPTIAKAFVFTGYIVNSIFNTAKSGVHDDNGQPAFIGQATYTDPAGKFTFLTTLGLGKDKLDGVTNSKVVLSDNDFTYNLNANQLVGLNYLYKRTQPDGAGADTVNGYGIYYKQTLTPKTGVAFRFSGYTDKNSNSTSPKAKPYELTATYELRPASNFTTRVEFRHDSVNSDNNEGLAFSDKDGNATKNTQDTLTVAGMFTF